MTKCEHCAHIYYRKEMKKNLFVCPNCDYHLQLNAWERINSLFDEGTFEEWDRHLKTNNPLHFPEYKEKLEKDRKKTGLNEAVVTGKGLVNEYQTAIGLMNDRYRIGSMSYVV